MGVDDTLGLARRPRGINDKEGEIGINILYREHGVKLGPQLRGTIARKIGEGRETQMPSNRCLRRIDQVV